MRLADILEAVNIQWHPGFYGAAELEFISNKGDLEFQREFNLSKEPIRMDLLIIKKLSNVRTENEIGHIFRKFNVVEYKSNDDALSIDDYYKTVGYACLYKGLGETVDQIPANELTISIFRESYPREMFEAMKNLGLEIKERYPGIYYISGKQALFDTQVVVTKQLNRETHRTLRVLSKHVKEEDVRAFVEEAALISEPGDRNNVDAVLQVSVSANKEIYEAIRRCDKVMCEALRELMKEDFEKQERETRQVTLLEDIKNLMDTTKWTAEQAMAALKIPEADRGKYITKL
ncbi:hypothetical protein [Sporofaciens sp. JLR.KK001]|mgnify:CR=1 FL=1|jgi:hypothetical protein|uniref:hypothetical protein n=1 Tax=Sporofaciens sp. JLR.KK001 TaxID=3112621 RepID=UPI002FF3035E